MGRAVMLSNGEMLVGLNEHGLVHDFYYPYIGQENLTTARSVHHMIGVWVNGVFSWIDDGSWHVSVDFESDALVSSITAEHKELGVRLLLSDFVDSQYNAFCRRIRIENLTDHVIEPRIFMHQVFQISNDGRADTVLYVPSGNYLFDYKGRCSLLIHARDSNHQPFDQFSVGNYGVEGKEGTYRDAEDGELSGNLVEHGGVDSVLRCCLKLEPFASDYVDYWVIASHAQHDAESIHKKFMKDGLSTRLDTTRSWWRNWLSIADQHINATDDSYKPLFKKSLMIVKSHIDKRGGIIASCDSSIYNYGRDYYSYVWPRDGALTMLTMIDLGYYEESRNFFEFCVDTIHPDGYMMHKYQPDRSIGSTWHPLMHFNHPELAIQEDETATVIYAIGKYQQASGDIDFVTKIYESLIAPASNFMARFIDAETGLPHATYDLWEEKFATHTYTVAVTVAALKEAARLADLLHRSEESRHWREAANQISDNMKQLFDQERGVYRKSQLLLSDGTIEYNNTVDSSSAYGVWFFDESRFNSDALRQAMSTTERMLCNVTPSGGAIRYENDNYFLKQTQYLGNPWIICTLWLAQYYARTGRQNQTREILDWTKAHITASGMLAEQVDPIDGTQVGVSPLVWSHAEFVNTILLLNKYR